MSEPAEVILLSEHSDPRARELENRVLKAHGPRIAQKIKEARQDERKRWPEFVAGAIEAATAQVRKQYETASEKDDAHHARHIKAHGRFMFFMGACIFLIVGSLVSAGGIAYVFKDAQLTNAAARQIERREPTGPALSVFDSERNEVPQDDGLTHNPISGRRLSAP